MHTHLHPAHNHQLRMIGGRSFLLVIAGHAQMFPASGMGIPYHNGLAVPRCLTAINCNLKCEARLRLAEYLERQ